VDSENVERDYKQRIMINWRELTTNEQIAALQNVAGAKHIPPQAVEKDLWVTTILQIVFSLPFADSLVFKGGTSLSKVFGKIERFSEDIDLAIDRTYFGLEGDLTKKQLKKLRKQSSTFVRDTFLGELQEAFRQHGLTELSATAEPDGEGDATYPEPRKIFIEYPSLFRESLDYIKPRVMLETGARSLIEPTILGTSEEPRGNVIPRRMHSLRQSVHPYGSHRKDLLGKSILVARTVHHQCRMARQQEVQTPV